MTSQIRALAGDWFKGGFAQGPRDWWRVVATGLRRVAARSGRSP